MNVAEWLRGLGLGQYAPAFRDNDIDAEVLRRLTAEDLHDLGVASIGHRRRLLDAIAALGESRLSERRSSARETRDAAGAVERRQLTVMFCDLVGSTALSAQLDPEDMREIIGVYYESCTKEIAKAGGFIARYMGDGVLAYFGYPRAHEDDAERAVRAALSLVEAVPKLRIGHGAELHVRIGIATGLAVVGDLIGEGAAREQGVVGDTPNLAARLQALAEPGQVVISNGTRQLTGGLFEYRDLGKVALKGLAVPVPAWRVIGASIVLSRFEAQHETGLAPLVGREEELELLLRRWREAANGEGQVVLLSGEPGIGKSRLLVAFQERLRDGTYARQEFSCSPQRTDSAFYPVIAQLEREAGFERHDTSEMKVDKMSSLIGLPGNRDEDSRLLSELLSLPADAACAPVDLPPRRKREKTLEALLRQVEVPSRQHPVFMVYEDVQWIDPSTRELLDRIVERVAHLPVLLVITFRPEFQPPWVGQTHVTTLNINRLARDEGAALVGSLAGNALLSADMVAEIVERTDGIPLFVEELTKAVMEVGADGKDIGAAVSKAPQSVLKVPATLHASLMSRLDYLGSIAKETAQVGAVIGREFPYELLTQAVQKSSEALNAGLKRLIDAGLVFCQGTPPQAVLLFKHALVRDVAYGTLLRGDRRRLHARIGEALEAQPEQAPAEILAHHFSEACMPPKAITYWVKAGQIASLRSAYAESVSHLTKGLGLLDQLPAGRERDLCELSLRSALGAAYVATRGASAPETVATYRRAAELLQATDDTRLRIAIHHGLFVAYNNLAQFDDALRLAEDALRQGEIENDDAAICVGHRNVAFTYNVMGKFEQAACHARRGWELYQPDRHGLAALGLFHDTGVGAKCHWAIALCLLGFQDQGRQVAADALSLAAGLRHMNSQGYAWFLGGVIVSFVGRDHDALREYATRLRELGQQHGIPQWAAWGRAFGAASLVTAGCVSAALEEIAGAIADCERLQNLMFRPANLAILASAELAAGRTEESLATTARALEIAERTGERWLSAEAWRLRGDVCAAMGRADDAEQCFQHALAMARSQSARLFGVRTASSIARLWRDQGKRSKARGLLAPIYGGFTEGFDTADLKEARTLLDELA